MARKLGLTHAEVVQAAQAIADTQGLDELSLAVVAKRLGVRSPSLYHHVSGLAGLRRELALLAATKLHDALASVAHEQEGRDALLEMARAYRRFARRHPGLMAALLPAPRRGDDDELYQAMQAVALVVAAPLQRLGLTGDEAIHAVRALRSFLHGFVDLEARGGFGMPQKLDTSFERGLSLLLDGLRLRAK